MISAALAIALATPGLQAATPNIAAQQAPAIEAKHKKALEEDVELGKKVSLDVEKQLKLSKNEEAIARVTRIGAEMAAIANSTQVEALWGDKKFSPFEYSFKVVEGEDVNAFSLPGGLIYVYEGLLKYVESDDELAGVLAHEIAHASLRHVATLKREASKLAAIEIPAILIAILAGGQAGTDLLRGIQLGGTAIGSGWSQKAEKAADYAGLQYIRKSGYDATGSLTVVERLAWDERNKPKIEWGIFRSHPPSDARVKDVGARMRGYNLTVRRSKVTQSFQTLVKAGKGDASEIWFYGKKLYSFTGTDAKQRADAAALKLNEFFDGVPSLIQVQSSGNRVLGGKQVLIEVTEQDAATAKQPVTSVVDDATKSIRSAVFSLSYRVWQP